MKKKNKSEEPTSSRTEDQKQLEQSLNEYQEILATAEEVAKIGSWRWDLRTQKVTWSDQMFQLFGVDPKGFDGDLNRVIAERIHPDDMAAINEANRRVLAESNPIPMSYRIVLPDGMQRTVWAQGKLIQDEAGQPVALIGFVQDITERVRAENKVLQLKRLYATLSQVNQMIVRVRERDELFQTICDVAVQFGELSLAWIGLLDKDSGEVRPIVSAGLEINQLILPPINIYKEEYQIALTTKVTISPDILTDARIPSLRDHFQAYPYRAMAIIPFRLKNDPIGVLMLFSREQGVFNDEEEIRLLDEMGLDISFALDRMESEQKHRAAERRFTGAFHSSPAAIMITRVSDGTIVDVNEAWCQALGHSREQAIGSTSLHLGITDARTRQHVIDTLQKTGTIRNLEARMITRSGDGRDMLLAIEMVELEGEQHALTTLIDITKRKQAEKQAAQMSRLYATLSQVNQMIVRVRGRDELFQTICDVSVKFGNFSLAWVGLLNENSGDIHPVAASGLDVKQWPFPIINIRTGEYQNSLTPTAIRENTVVISDDLQNDQRTRNLRDSIKPYKYHAAAAIPIHLRDKVIGVLVLISPEAGLFNDEAEVKLLEEMGLDISFALHNMENEKERQQVEEKLQRSQETYQQLFKNNPHPMWVYDLETLAFLMVNDAAVEHYGYSREEFLKMTIKDIRPPEDLPSLLNNLMQAPLPLERSSGWRHRKKDGTLIDVEITSHAIPFEGRPSRLVLANDITERKQAEEALQQSERILRLFVEHSPASIAMFDRDMKYIVASNRYKIDYRLGEQELIGRSHYEVFPEIPDHWKDIHQRCLNGAIEKAEQDPFPREDGTLDWVRWEIHPWYEETGQIGGIILFSEVITERKQVQDELRLLNLELEQRVVERTFELAQANRAKDEFLANMSHELRTPLNTVLGLSETLLEQRRGGLNEKQIQSIELIAASGRHLLGLINDVLEVSKIEAGKLQLHPTRVYIKELCESSLNFIREMALKKSINVEFNNPESILTLHADPQRLKQILINLLVNAVKFTPERGRINLDVRTNSEKDRILFAVTDTGIGIAHEDLKKLFTPFTQLDSSLARQYAGTGLGLALVQKLTDLHGGSVQVESELGKGSRFTIALPFRQDIAEQTHHENLAAPAKVEGMSAPASTVSKERRLVLLAEDNRVNAEMILEYLEAQGYQVLIAQNGEEVLEKAQQTQPAVILMDIQMPKMDGLEAMRHLRQDPRFVSTPIIALTALAMTGDKERSLEAGANEYLSKPVSLKKLAQIIDQLTTPNS